MAKRFTDTGKWQKTWFSDLSKDEKLLWIYILDHCDYAGIYEPNWKLTNFMLETNFDAFPQSILKQIEQTNHERRWFVADFVAFQYGTLKLNSSMHKKVFLRLKEYDISVATDEGGNRVSAPSKKKKKNNIKNKEKTNELKSLSSIDKEFLNELQLKNLSIDVKDQFDRFKDFLSANGKSYKDYRAAFRNWIKSPYVEKTDRIRNRIHEEKKAQERKENLAKPVDVASPEEIREALSNVNKVRDKMEWKQS